MSIDERKLASGAELGFAGQTEVADQVEPDATELPSRILPIV